MNAQFEIGDVVEYAGKGSEAYVIAVSSDKLQLLFYDGSCGWHFLTTFMGYKRTFKKWNAEKIKSVATEGLYCRASGDKSYIDNLTYIELLDRIKNESQPQ